MRRDWDMIREILICIEETDALGDPADGDLWANDRAEHIALLVDSGLIDGLDVEYDFDSPPRLMFQPKPRLTWPGHDFLDAIRDDSVWKKTTESVAKAGGSATLTIIINLATKFLSEKLGLS